MSKEGERLQDARWALERNLGWIASSDAKAGFIAAIVSAMLAALAIAYSDASLPRSDWSVLLTATASAFLGGSIVLVGVSVLPQLERPHKAQKSYFYFGDVADEKCSEFSERLSSADDAALLADCLEQLHRNAQVANRKFSLVRSSIFAALLGFFPWVGALGTLVNQ